MYKKNVQKNEKRKRKTKISKKKMEKIQRLSTPSKGRSTILESSPVSNVENVNDKKLKKHSSCDYYDLGGMTIVIRATQCSIEGWHACLYP